jgi:hypothetical protein
MTRVAKISACLLLLVAVGALAVTVLTEPEAEHEPAQPPPVRTSAPIQIPGVEIESHDHVPPMVDSNGNLYRVTEDDEDNGNRPRMMKSSDGGDTWVEQDAAHRPTTGDTEGGWALQDGPTIWFAWQKSATVHLTRFNTSDHPTGPDSYQVRIEDVASPPDPGPQYASLAKNDDGSLWIAYGSARSGDPRSALVKRNADGTYTTPVTIDPETATTAPRLVQGNGETTYVFYKDHEHHRIYYRSLSPSGTLSSPTRVDSGGTHTTETPLTNVVHYSADGAEVLVVMYAGPDGTLRSVAVRDGVVGPEQRVSSTPVTIDPGVTTNLAAVAHLAAAGTTVIAMWSDATDGNVYLDQRAERGQWGSDVLTVDTGAGTTSTAQYVYANVLRHAGGRATVGFTYDLGPTVDDESNIFYGQVAVSTAPR